MKDNQAKKITLFYLFVVTTIAILCIVSQCIIQYALHHEIETRTLASTIGQQRGRSFLVEDDLEKLALFPEQKKILLQKTKEDLRQWDMIQQATYHGNTALNIPSTLPDPIRTLITANAPRYTTMYRAATFIITDTTTTPATTAHLKIFIENQFPYQDSMLQIYTMFSAEADRQIATIQIIELVLCLLMLSVIFSEHIFVSVPNTKKLTALLTPKIPLFPKNKI